MNVLHDWVLRNKIEGDEESEREKRFRFNGEKMREKKKKKICECRMTWHTDPLQRECKAEFTRETLRKDTISVWAWAWAWAWAWSCVCACVWSCVKKIPHRTKAIGPIVEEDRVNKEEGGVGLEKGNRTRAHTHIRCQKIETERM